MKFSDFLALPNYLLTLFQEFGFVLAEEGKEEGEAFFHGVKFRR
jgi:hypothetical protein